MKPIRQTLPRGAPYDERALALAKRLIPDLPPWLNPPASEKRWMILWAAIGMELAEKEPEFGWGPGRRPGSKSAFQQKIVTPAAVRQRRSRANRFQVLPRRPRPFDVLSRGLFDRGKLR
jgi:hypothetical protein